MTPAEDIPVRTAGHAIRIRLGQLLGLLFLIGPIADLTRASLSPVRLGLISAGLAGFIALYLGLLPPARTLARRGSRALRGCLVLLALLEVFVLAVGAPGSFLALSFYVVAATGLMLRTRPALAIVVAVSAALGIGLAVSHSKDGTIFATTLSCLSVGVMMVAFARKIQANRELQQAREELADLAVTEERLRIARDLHDLLGHSLSVVALKSELAHRVVDTDPDRARAELADVQRVARQALADVREAVRGYRQLALDDAVGSARTALSAAGIDCRVEGTAVALPAEVESVLAWAVREAATNVVRHSDARACAISVRAEPTQVELAIDDDGSAAASPDGSGSGLAGLAERAAGLHGTLETGVGPEGGFRLRLTVPLPAS